MATGKPQDVLPIREQGFEYRVLYLNCFARMMARDLGDGWEASVTESTEGYAVHVKLSGEPLREAAANIAVRQVDAEGPKCIPRIVRMLAKQIQGAA